MAVDEARRHSLGEKVREVLGVDDGETLMEMLPGVGWADVATKHDLDVIREQMATKADLHAQTTQLLMWLVPFNIGVALAITRLA